MKKLLALVLVFAMASLASATIVSLDGEDTTIEAVPGDVTIMILSDAPLWGLDVIVTVTGGDVISAAMSGADSATYGWDPTLPIPPAGLGTAVVEVGGTTFTAAAAGPAVAYITVAYTGGEQVVSLAMGSAFGGSYDAGFSLLTASNFSTDVVTIIPEPMTVALLGLGGLFLRRRRS